jgi:hypothetical protein
MGEAKEVLAANVRGTWQRNAILLSFLLLDIFHKCEERRKTKGKEVKHEEQIPKLPFLDIH